MRMRESDRHEFEADKLYKCKHCGNAPTNELHLGVMIPWNVRSKRCAACREDELQERQFLCRQCLERLPDDVRRNLLRAEEWDSLQVKRDALRALGIDPNTRDISLPQKPEPPKNKCACENVKPHEVSFQRMLTGSETPYHRKCGLRVEVKA